MPTDPDSAAARAESGPVAAVTVDLLVLAGGRGSRLGGALKPAVDVAGRTLLSRVLDARPLVRHTVVVAPDAARPAAGAADPFAGTPHAAGGGSAGLDAGDLAGPATAGGDSAAPATLTWALEDPPFGGPVAGIAAGLAALDAADTPDPAEWLLVLACDLPWAADAARHLLTALADVSIDGADTADTTQSTTLDGLYLVDDTGRDQWLVGVYRAAALRAGAARLGPAVHGASVRQLLAGLTLRGLPDAAQASADVDTWQDVTLSTERLRAEQTDADRVHAEHPKPAPDPHSSDPHSSGPHAPDAHPHDPHSPDPHSPDPHSPDPHSPRSTVP